MAVKGHPMNRLLAAILFFMPSIAVAVPLSTVPAFCSSYPDQCNIGAQSLLVVRGTGTNAYYVLEADPTTGSIPVTAIVTFPYDENYGTPGATTLRTASMLGVGATAVSNANPVPISDAGGSITVDGTVAATQSGVWTVTTTTNGAPTGRAYADSVRNDYSSTNVTTGAWVQLIASTAAVINRLYIDDTCGQVLELGTGAALSEARKLIIPRGGLAAGVELAIPAATRVSIRAITATCSTGDFVLTGLQ